jgi:elongation factor Ts
MSKVPAELVKKLRATTGAGILDCRKALEDSGGDLDEAVKLLREKGLAMAAKRAGRQASEGVLEMYSHGDGRVGVMVEVNCETDFVGRSEDFRKFAHEIALQVAAAAPLYVSEEEIPEAVIEQEKQIAEGKARQEGKPDKIIPRIIEGYIKKYIDDNCLLRQPYIRDDSMDVQALLNETVAKVGENIVIRRFVRWSLGESSEEE